ncbi:arrestin [Moelleriella libera RCEF 2490]|uniref:Arrestin n=1 Tax=Moelleriella libera RCEF 2490 TaxID=1081109 RepID=A0A166NMZ5_9HYPO|nr:arrestin [Moelleriella libera RCEF 2490]
MSIRIALDERPEFYTNLDFIKGRVILGLTRAEQVGNIVVKLEGESVTALQVPAYNGDLSSRPPPGSMPGPPGSVVSENHKILYKVLQIFPDEYHSSSSNPYGAFPLQPGEHEFPFKFKVPINNACSDPDAMSKLGGLGGLGGFGSGGGLFGMGGVRVMDGTKQLGLRHVTKTLPPSLTGYPMEAEVRYYIKVTVQRPGILKENWRYQIGYKFLPMEPPRPARTGQEAYASRPFTFRPRSPAPQALSKKKSSFFFGRQDRASATENGDSGLDSPGPVTVTAPSIEMSARLPYPSVLTCNQPIPLRLIAKKLAESPEQLNLVSFQMDLIGITEVRSHNIYNRKMNRWVVASNTDLNIPLTSGPNAPVGSELVLPDTMWKERPLPNTVAPSFVTCNLSRRYEVELKLGICWGKAKSGFINNNAQTIHLPLHFAVVEVYSGITPPAELVEAARNSRPGRATLTIPPRLPPRVNSTPSSPVQSQGRGQSSAQAQAQRPAVPHRPAHDPLYPPQLQPGQTAAPYDDAPPSYDEAVAENMAGPFDGLQSRPAYSGVTNENAPSQMPAEKR